VNAHLDFFQTEESSMTRHTTLIATTLLAAALTSGTAHAVLQGRDLNGSAGSFEAYYDTVLDITWLADANYALTSGYAPALDWDTANTWAAGLSFTNPLTNQTYDDWRLPIAWNDFDPQESLTINPNILFGMDEMEFMFYFNGVGTLTPGPFINLFGRYWTGTELFPGDPSAFFAGMDDGDVWSFAPKYITYGAWAVSAGDIAAVPEADTWAMLLAGLGLVGVAASYS
jgi:hypothetical protein